MAGKKDSSQEEFRKKVAAEKAAWEAAERRSLESAYVERPSCWRFISAAGWTAGVGGLLCACGGILGLTGNAVISSDWAAIMTVTGLASLTGGIFSMYLRPQWTRTLMELRALQERAGARIASTSMDRLAQNEADSERRMKELNDDFVRRLETMVVNGTSSTADRLHAFETRLDRIVRDWEGGDEYSREAYNFIGEIRGTLAKLDRSIGELGTRLEKLEKEGDSETAVKEEEKPVLRGYGLTVKLGTSIRKPQRVQPPEEKQSVSEEPVDSPTDDETDGENDENDTDVGEEYGTEEHDRNYQDYE